MSSRMNIFQQAPEVVKAMMGVETSLKKGGLESELVELVKVRASQINGCAFCIHMHVTDALKAGESDMRLLLLNGWRESSFFSDRERAALAWTETLTTVSETGAPDEDYKLLESLFSEKEIAYLTLLVGTINLWNRVQIGTRAIHPAQ
ncbi:carboxymuconolactone decarboxylase family protein [Candidatus Nitrotoga sp. M5]|uniref:carboxymuconolactone decarboxylase family protein n=1 Tax=Candidatus Nitrotoga sp. M5 TaxID=2890409 RepID=UPI001EF5AD0B|nr:carboxymuconolactone decarboxylase family protein [Candidatus Nitrotoga sp. M5]CAH1387488.1 Alkylhydroperoxidase [Candidatus Nitrotoga sp. M5]